jgi:drug/metabolite transporter (DMT)-like permease
MSWPSAQRRRRFVGIALIALSASSFATLGIFARFAYAAGATPDTLLLLRFALAGGIMLLVLRVQHGVLPHGRDLVGLLLMGGIGYVGQSFCYFLAVQYASVSLVAVLLYVYPALVTVLAATVLHERLTWWKGIALMLSLAGTVLVVGSLHGGQPLGIVLALSGAIVYSIYILVGSRLTPRVGTVASTTTIMLAAAGVFALLTIMQGPHWPTTLSGWGAAGAIAVIPTVLAMVSFFAGLARIGPTDASMLSTLEPIVTVLLATVLLGESLGGLQYVGGALILSAVLILARK